MALHKSGIIQKQQGTLSFTGSRLPSSQTGIAGGGSVGVGNTSNLAHYINFAFFYTSGSSTSTKNCCLGMIDTQAKTGQIVMHNGDYTTQTIDITPTNYSSYISKSGTSYMLINPFSGGAYYMISMFEIL